MNKIDISCWLSLLVRDLKSTDVVNELNIVLSYITSFTPQFKIMCSSLFSALHMRMYTHAHMCVYVYGFSLECMVSWLVGWLVGWLIRQSVDEFPNASSLVSYQLI
jgi:hypothetical protein